MCDTVTQDVMQICRNGHVITDLLRTNPDRALTHCDRCGAPTIEQCPTCGKEFPGALAIPGLHLVGARRPPLYCPSCGAGLPWAEQPATAAPSGLACLEAMLIRVPRVVRQLRVRHGERPPFRVHDERDLEDLLRSLLPLHFDDIRPQCRTPLYADTTRTDFLLATERIALMTKLANTDLREVQLARQLRVDIEYYSNIAGCNTLVVFVFDPECMLRDAAILRAAGKIAEFDLELRCIVGAPQ
jgi:hypothetical protein